MEEAGTDVEDVVEPDLAPVLELLGGCCFHTVGVLLRLGLLRPRQSGSYLTNTSLYNL